MNEDATPDLPEDAPPAQGMDDVLEPAGGEEAAPSTQTPEAGTPPPDLDGKPDGPPRPTGPPPGPKKDRIPPKSFLEKVASLGLFLWALVTLGILGGAAAFLIMFLMKYKAI